MSKRSSNPRLAFLSQFTRRSHLRADGVIEILIVLAAVALFVIVVLFLPRLRARSRPSGINCINNVKQIGLAARMWVQENYDKFPWEVSIRSNGVKEISMSGN